MVMIDMMIITIIIVFAISVHAGAVLYCPIWAFRPSLELVFTAERSTLHIYIWKISVKFCNSNQQRIFQAMLFFQWWKSDKWKFRRFVASAVPAMEIGNCNQCQTWAMTKCKWKLQFPPEKDSAGLWLKILLSQQISLQLLSCHLSISSLLAQIPFDTFRPEIILRHNFVYQSDFVLWVGGGEKSKTF